MAHKEYIDEQTKRIIDKLDGLDRTTQLIMKDLSYIRMAMINVSVRWYNIGVHFGLLINTLDSFRSKNRNDSDKCLTCVIAEWIKNFPKKLGPPTWRKVAIAVSSRVGGDNPSEACKIAKEYNNYDDLRSSFNNSEEVDNRPLSSVNYHLVVDAIMRGVADKWIAIGVFLGVQYKDIKYFDDDEDRLEDRITKMVTAWLGRKYNVEAYGEPSWRKLTEAIAAPSGGSHLRLATKIAEEHPVEDTVDPPLATVMASSLSGNSPSSSSNRIARQSPDDLLEQDIPRLLNLLQPAAHRWELLCLELGVPMGELKNIASHPMYISGGPIKFLLEGLYIWVKSNSGGSKATFSALIDALKSPIVNEEYLSGQIKAYWESSRDS